MRYYKQVEDDYIIAIGSGDGGGTEITSDEYDSIMAVIKSAPSSENKGYKLKTDLTWEEYDIEGESVKE